MNGAAPAGWHPDPANPSSGALRYWDGNQWTDQVRPGTTAAPPFPPPATGYPAFGSQPYGQQPYAPWGGGRNQPGQSLMSSNQRSIVAIGFAIVYIAVALLTSFIFLGIVPVLSTIRAFQRREKLAPVALVFSVIVVIITIVSLSRR